MARKIFIALLLISVMAVAIKADDTECKDNDFLKCGVCKTYKFDEVKEDPKPNKGKWTCTKCDKGTPNKGFDTKGDEKDVDLGAKTCDGNSFIKVFGVALIALLAIFA